MAPDNLPKKLNWRESAQAMLQKLKQNQASSWILLGMALCGILLLFWGKDPVAQKVPARDGPEIASSVTPSGTDSSQEQRRLEEALTRTLSLIDGVGTVKVEITLKSGSRRVWERQTHSNKRTSQEQGGDNHEEETSDELVLAKDRDGREDPVLKEELGPEVQGVLVVASGARDGHIREILAGTVMTVLDLPAYRVMVMPGEFQTQGGGNHE